MIQILYNENCPICDMEICHYRSYTQRNGIALGFADLAHFDGGDYGIDPEAALRRLHIVEAEEVFFGSASVSSNLAGVTALSMARLGQLITGHFMNDGGAL